MRRSLHSVDFMHDNVIHEIRESRIPYQGWFNIRIQSIVVVFFDARANYVIVKKIR